MPASPVKSEVKQFKKNNSDENNVGREPISNQQESSSDLDGSDIINSGASEEEVSAPQMNGSNGGFVDADVPVDKEMDITSCVPVSAG